MIDAGDVPGIKERELLSDERYRELVRDFHAQFVAKMGAEAIKELLAMVNVEELAVELRKRMKEETSQQKKLKFSKRLKVTTSFLKSGNHPEWMILDVIPVIPPELRPLVPLDGGRFATSDLNDLYRRVINRNNVEKLMYCGRPKYRPHEKRMFMKLLRTLRQRPAVRSSWSTAPLNAQRTLKVSRAFSQKLLGKRVDYSGVPEFVRIWSRVECIPVFVCRRYRLRLVSPHKLVPACYCLS